MCGAINRGHTTSQELTALSTLIRASLPFLFLQFLPLQPPRVRRTIRRIHNHSIQTGVGVLRLSHKTKYRFLRALRQRCTKPLQIRDQCHSGRNFGSVWRMEGNRKVDDLCEQRFCPRIQPSPPRKFEPQPFSSIQAFVANTEAVDCRYL